MKTPAQLVEEITAQVHAEPQMVAAAFHVLLGALQECAEYGPAGESEAARRMLRVAHKHSGAKQGT